MNGCFIDCDSDDAFEFLMGLYDRGSFRRESLEPWIEEHLRPLTGTA